MSKEELCTQRKMARQNGIVQPLLTGESQNTFNFGDMKKNKEFDNTLYLIQLFNYLTIVFICNRGYKYE